MYFVILKLITIIKKSNHINPILNRLWLTTLVASFCMPVGLQAGDTDLPVEAANFDVANTVNVVRSGTTNPVLDINHTVDKTVLNWESFNIGKDSTVNFNQLSNSSLTLNRIGQQSASEIFGNLNANGRIYLINQNGILFGEGAQINVNELTASTLNITEEIFENGILTAIQNQEAAFVPFKDENGNDLVSQNITIQSGAEINAESGGRIMMFAPSIENNGIINTPDGQTILAAGNKVYLLGSSDPNLRGLLVEVSSGGDVVNLGDIIAERGNVTLAGLAINQGGRIKATTSTSANGSIRLLARDTDLAEPFQKASNNILTNKTGEVVFGENSVTEILAELNSEDVAIDDQIQYKSRVEIMGEKIHLKGNSQIIAKGGEVDIQAVKDPSSSVPLGQTPVPRSDDVVVQIDAGSKIDVSGNSTTLEMSRNNIEVELRGNELKDLPLQRNGSLRGQKVVLDLRKVDDFELGDISGNLGAVERSVAERTSEGGLVKINSEGDIRFLQGAEIDVSGGVINYREGEIQTTFLKNGNLIVDIHEADPNVIYDGVFNIQSFNETAYIEGKNAGTVQFAANGIIADGTLTGNVSVGRYQRTEATRPQGGKLIIGLPDGQSISDFRAPNITLQDLNLFDSVGGYDFSKQGDDFKSFDEAGLGAFRNELALSKDFLSSGGFTRVELNSNGKITIKTNESLNLAPNSQVQLKGQRINVDSSIISDSGDISLTATNINTNINGINNESGGIYIADNVTLDVSGNWTNDNSIVNRFTEPSSPIMLDGGSIKLQTELRTSTIELGDNVSLLALGGARLDSSNNLSSGAGGSISIETLGEDSNLEFGLNNSIAAYGLEKGGSFNLVTNTIDIDSSTIGDWKAGQSSTAKSGVTTLPDFFFSDLGFSEFNITANQGNLNISSDASVNIITSNYFIPASAYFQSSGRLSSVLNSNSSNYLSFQAAKANAPLAFENNIGFLNAENRKSVIATFSTLNETGLVRQKLNLSSGSSITADPGSNINFFNGSGGIIDINGTINALGSNIKMTLERTVNQEFSDTSYIAFGENAHINIGGTFASIPDRLGLNRSKTFDAGDLDVTSSGYIVIEDGAKIKSAGASGRFDLVGGISSENIQRNRLVNTEAGDFSFRAAEGIINDGELDLSPGTGEGAYAGSLTYEVDRRYRGDVQTGIIFSNTVPEITVTQTGTDILADNFKAGDSISDSLNGSLLVRLDEISNSKADQLSILLNEGSIKFDGDIEFTLKRDIVFDASVFESDGGNVNLTANYISLGSDSIGSRTPESLEPTSGLGSFNINADLIDIIGLSTYRGFNLLNFNGVNDIRIRGVGNQNIGELALDGNLNLHADRIYPTTMTSFLLDSRSGDINISTDNSSPNDVLSAGGSLTFKGKNINQQGNILAPIGTINFEATDDVTLSNGSLTSVSANGQSILLGQTLNGLEWLYSTSSSINNARILYSGNQQNMPEKNISFSGTNINIDEGATVDLSGGGEILNWEFVPGPGGSIDNLASENAENLFAVLPNFNEFAPFDAQEFSGWDLSAGESIYLAGGNGLAAGVYTKLPARYALLPGAFLIESVNGINNIPLSDSANVIDGTLVAGFDVIKGTDLAESNTSGYIIRQGDYINQLNEYNVNTADQIVSTIAQNNDFALPRLTRDAGRLSLSGSETINLNGTIATTAAEGGRGAIVDITAEFINIVDSISSGTAGVTQLLASSINSLMAESILVGGERVFSADGTKIDAQTTNLTIENNVELTAPELIFIAKNNLNINSGTKLINNPGSFPETTETYNIDGDNALVRVSSGPQVILNRTGATGTNGTVLTIEDGVELLAQQSITIDSTGDLISGATFGENVDQVLLGASEISIGDITGVGGLILDDSALSELAGQDLILRTNGQINFYGSSEILVDNLVFNAKGLVADQSSLVDVNIEANTVTFGNSFGSSDIVSIDSPNGEFSMMTNELNLTDGEFRLSGFSDVNATIAGATIGSGDSTLLVNGNLNMATQKITAISGSDLSILSSGNIVLSKTGGTSNVASNDLAASIAISGKSVNLDTVIEAPVGKVSLIASEGDVVLGSNSLIETSGVSIDVLGVSQLTTSGGSVEIESKQGNVEIQLGSEINANSGGTGSEAGEIALVASKGDVSVKGSLRAANPKDQNGEEDFAKGGRVRIDAKSIGNSTNVASKHTFSDLLQSFGDGLFTGSQDIRLREGDISLAAIDSIKANRIRLTAEGENGIGGNISINGELGATDKVNGGLIELFAKNNLDINSGANIFAAATSQASDGKVVLSARNGTIDIDSSTNVVAGSTGKIYLRTSRNDTDVNINRLNGNLDAEEISIQAFKSYENTATLDTGTFSTIQSETNVFMQTVDAIKTRLGLAGDDRVSVTPGVEVSNNGDINIATKLDFSNLRYGDTPGLFFVRSSDDINVNQTVTDGVGSSGAVLTDESWSYEFTAGADFDGSEFSANPYQTNNNAVGNFNLAANRLVRTGSGDITINAANDITFGNDSSVIYTLGKRSGFELDRTATSNGTKLVPIEGGDLVINAGGNIIGSGNSSSTTQLINEWFRRQNYDPGVVVPRPDPLPPIVIVPPQDAGTWLDFNNFQQGVAAFGGGNVTVSAGGDIERLSVSAPTFITGDSDTREISRFGSGDINVNSGGDIEGGIFFVGDGDASIISGGDIVHGRTSFKSGQAADLDAVFAVMGGSVDVVARGDLVIESVFNPTVIDEGTAKVIFSSYENDTSSSFTSLAGTVINDPTFVGIQDNTSTAIDVSNNFQYTLFPGSLRLAALKEDLILKAGSINLFPTTDGGAEFYAGGSIVSEGGTASVNVAEEPLSLIPSLNEATDSTSTLRLISQSTLTPNPPLHINDINPSWFVADTGDIQGTIILDIPEQSRLFAGRDITNIRLRGQNLIDSDITRVEAGRDIRFSAINNAISIGGPGRLEVIAKRDIDLGPSVGIETKGNLSNPILDDVGADIIVQAGIGDGAQYLSFYKEYFLEGKEFHGVLKQYLDAKYETSIEVDAFLSMSAEQQWDEIEEQFIPQIISGFYSELKTAGRDPNKDFSRGFTAIDILFPESQFNRNEAYGNLSLKEPGETNDEYFARLAEISDYSGDLSLFFSKVYSLDGGTIDILVPGGFINAGLASPPVNSVEKAAGELGVVAQSTGEIRSYSRGSFQVNQSRVSTLLGGDILLWSSTGDLDAGRGSKTAISAPEPIISITDQGDVTVDLSNTVSGSGIRAVSIDPSIDPDDIDVDLVAPNGIVDAGDAGIATSGNLNISAIAVIGADNIQVGGIAVGVPTASAGGVSTAGIGGTGDVTRAATQEAVDSSQEEAAPDDGPVEEAPQLSFISVEILGFGYDDVLEEEEEEDEEDEENAEVSYIKPENTEDLG